MPLGVRRLGRSAALLLLADVDQAGQRLAITVGDGVELLDDRAEFLVLLARPPVEDVQGVGRRVVAQGVDRFRQHKQRLALVPAHGLSHDGSGTQAQHGEHRDEDEERRGERAIFFGKHVRPRVQGGGKKHHAQAPDAQPQSQRASQGKTHGSTS